MRLRAPAVLACALLVTSASAQPDDPLAAVIDADPVELARAVDRVGDDAVLERLAAAELLGVHASPYMAEPEVALPRLVELARGRDPWLAPAAMSAILTIAEGPLLDAMDRREREPGSLEPVLTELRALEEDGTARADLRGAAALARAQLVP